MIPDKGLSRFGIRGFLKVPCGHCVGCSRDRINDWFVRLYSEFHVRDMANLPSYFVTITIDPDLWPSMTKKNPNVAQSVSAFIRSWSERARYVTGRSLRRFFCSEFGSADEVYFDRFRNKRITTGALHFHGFIFSDVDMQELQRSLRLTHGYFWYVRMTDTRMVRYAVSYATKDYSEDDPSLRARVFASPNLGNYSFFFGESAPTSYVLINGFHYRTPRYFFNKFYGAESVVRNSTLSRLRSYLDQTSLIERSGVSSFLDSPLYKGSSDGQILYDYAGILPLYHSNLLSRQHPVIRRHDLNVLHRETVFEIDSYFSQCLESLSNTPRYFVDYGFVPVPFTPISQTLFKT